METNMPIIDPKTIYLWNLCDGLRTLCTVFLVLSSMLAATLVVCYGICTAANSWSNETNKKETLKWLKRSFIIIIPMALCVVFIPSKEIIIEMTVTKYITVTNIDWTMDKIKELAEYIVGLLK